MKLDGFTALASLKPEDASLLVQYWFNQDDIIVISGKRAIRQQSNVNVFSQSLTALEFVTQMSTDEGKEILRSLSYDPEQMDVYINVGTPAKPLTDPRQRVKEDYLRRVIGIIGDFDVGKEKAFESTEQIYDFLRSLKIQPTIVVESGSGGVHAWWKFSEQNATIAQGKDVQHRWWAYLDKAAQDFCGARVDKLIDTARMMRLPGTVHWSRNLAGPPSVVSLSRVSNNPRPMMDFINASEDAWKVRLADVHKTREQDRSLKISTDEYVKMLDGNKWEQLLAVASVEDYFNQHVTWSDILMKAGWTFTRMDSQNREEWARPGREGEKSACVNWPESPEMMSLLSTSYDTGLLDLLDANIALTKWRVSLRLNFDDDYQAMVKWTLEQMHRARG